MGNEEAYLDYIIKNVNDEIKPILESFLHDSINFDDFVIELQDPKFNVQSYNTFLKSKKMENLL